MKILVADDDPISRKILSTTLPRYGYAVQVANDGNEAWAQLQKDDKPDLALLDWQMPGMDGPEICQRLRQQRASRYTYVILVTSSGSTRDAADGLEAGADDFIVKPFDAEELRARVRAGQRLMEYHGELARSRAYLEAVLANIDSAVLLMDASGRVVYGNEALARISGMPLDVALNLTREDFIRFHAEHQGDGSTLVDRLGIGDMLPLGAEIDVEVTSPEHRILRWIAKQVSLPGGPGELDLLRDVTDEVERDHEQTRLARVDHLTGLHNRHAAEEIFAREFSRARRLRQPLSVILADIDLFKRVNDVYGHPVGDQVLREVSHALAACCRVTDVAIRWGGEELMVVLPNTALEGARILAERMRTSVFGTTNPGLPRVTISCGVAALGLDDAAIDAVLERADARLYEAKASGRNTVR
jgi:two-component system cell cycle response regulator